MRMLMSCLMFLSAPLFAVSSASVTMKDDPGKEIVSITMDGDLATNVFNLLKKAHLKNPKRVTVEVSGEQKNATYSIDNIYANENRPLPGNMFFISLDKEEWLKGWNLNAQLKRATGLQRPSKISVSLPNQGTAKTMIEVMNLAGVVGAISGDREVYRSGNLTCSTATGCTFADEEKL